MTQPEVRNPIKKAGRRPRGSMLELAPSIMILLVCVVFPFINLMGVVVGYATGFLITHQASRQAAAQPKFDDALAVMLSETGNLTQSGIGRFVKLKPIGGYQNGGTDLYVRATNYYSNQVQRFGPNTPLPPPIDASTFIYEYSVPGTFDVGPLVDMSTVPFLGGVPGLGPPARIRTVCDRVVEHPEGLGGGVATNDQFQSPIPPSSPSSQPTAPAGGPAALADSGWNYPNIYQMIQSAGQTVIDETVLQVAANNANWTSTTINVPPGAKIWIDYRADGLWTVDPSNPVFDANGLPGGNPTDGYGFQEGAMLGKLDNGQPFFLGNRQWNFTPPGTGSLQLVCNDGPDSYVDNSGTMTVRVIVAQ